MLHSRFSQLENLEKKDNETPHIYVRKIEFACEYFWKTKNDPHLMYEDVMASMTINCLPTRETYIILKERLCDMQFAD